jgi:CHAT domain-containing protein
LFTQLLGPVATAIRDKDLLIVASGPLTSLPFHVLVAEKPGTGAPANGGSAVPIAWVARRNAVTMLPSLASLKSLRAFAGSGHAATPFLGVGNPLLTGESGTDRRAWSRESCGPSAPGPKWTADIASLSPLSQLLRRGVADVETLRRLTPLPETADELCSVAKFVGAADDAVLLGSSATETRIKSLSAMGALANARILHFATHGLLAGETELFLRSHAEPALILTPPDKASDTDDGLLAASEIAELKLDADWVVLSACNTASGETVGAEAMSGLARAFFYAGARSLMVSHWAVNSDATVKLVTRAFAAMKQNPALTQAGALQLAMLTMVDSPGLDSHPANWAPFIIVGGNAPAARPEEAAFETGESTAAAGTQSPKPTETASTVAAVSADIPPLPVRVSALRPASSPADAELPPLPARASPALRARMAKPAPAPKRAAAAKSTNAPKRSTVVQSATAVKPVPAAPPRVARSKEKPPAGARWEPADLSN